MVAEMSSQAVPECGYARAGHHAGVQQQQHRQRHTLDLSSPNPQARDSLLACYAAGTSPLLGRLVRSSRIPASSFVLTPFKAFTNDSSPSAPSDGSDSPTSRQGPRLS